MPAELAALCSFLCVPESSGGLLVRGARPGPGRQALLALVEDLTRQTGRRLVRLAHATAAESLGKNLLMVESLAAGRPVYSQDWFEKNRGALVVVSMAERLEVSLAHRLARALDDHELFVLALDESEPHEAGVAPSLRDRLTMVFDLEALQQSGQALTASFAAAAVAARQWWASGREPPGPPLSDEQLLKICALAQAVGIQSSRPVLATAKLAQILTRWSDPEALTVSSSGLEQALLAALLPHARHRPVEPAQPQPPQESQPQPPQESQESRAQADASAEAPSQDSHQEDRQSQRPPDPDPDTLERAVEAALAQLERGLLDRALSKTLRNPQPARREGGRAGQPTWHPSRGRRVRTQPWRRGLGVHQLAWVKTLERALPLQKWRSVSEDQGLVLQPTDLRVWRRLHRRPVTTVFLVDASGSMAATRLAEVKGAVQTLLADCYVRRDQVALLSFGGRGAQVILSPTRSLVAAKRALTALPGGGASPVAAGLRAVSRLVDQLTRDGEDATIVVLSDGRANLSLAGEVDRRLAGEEALRAAAQLAGRAVCSLWIDASPRSEPAAAALAQAMTAHYHPLPFASAGQIHGLIKEARQARTAVGSTS